MSKKPKPSEKELSAWEDLFRDAIHKSGLNFMDISRASGVDHSQLSRFMQSKRGLSIVTAERVAKVVGLELRPVKAKKARQ